MITFTEGPGKSWTLEIFQECLLCYDQLQQRSGHANVLVCRLVFSRLIIIFFFSRDNNIPEIFRCSRFSRFDCKLAWDQVPYCWEKGKNRAQLASIADIFPILTPFFAFFPQCEAWSQANCNQRSFFTIRSQRHLLLTLSTSKAK